MMIHSIAALVVAATALSTDDARILTSMVASAADDVDGVEVLTREDLRKAAELDAERQAMGCDAHSCLAELAQAMGAGIVVYGSVGTFGDALTLELSAFDADGASSRGRKVLRATDLGALSDVAVAATRELVGTSTAGETRRVLVLDLELRNAAVDNAPANEAPVSMWTITGGSALGLGAIGLVVAIGANQVGLDNAAAAAAVDEQGQLTATTSAVKQHNETLQIAQTVTLVSGIASGVLIAGGVGLLLVPVISE